MFRLTAQLIPSKLALVAMKENGAKRHAWLRPMMTEAPVEKPAMTEWERKLVIQPRFKMPTAV